MLVFMHLEHKGMNSQKKKEREVVEGIGGYTIRPGRFATWAFGKVSEL